MTSRINRVRRPWFFAACIVALSLGVVLDATGCGRESPPRQAVPRTAPEGKADQAYTVKGVIDAMPTADGKQMLMVHHRAIPGFVGAEGKVVGMPEHSMSFPWLATDLDLAGLREGDGVELTFEVRWRSKPRSLVTRITKLPPGTRLGLMKVVETGGGEAPK